MVLQISTAYLTNASQRPKPHESVSGWASPPPRLVGRNAGCDAVLSNCGPNGGCCDEHDDCWDLKKCTALS
ncbi:unnamed protein product [Adineta steineri]|uniref:Uncharacterized protein n=1 Tax=Adineta steineri TaxID=433720 RepID=A0A813SU01_9BILA|nr:unnamed protein product [Adineta steineri]CAF3851169.1 unnamed protein product [Adineta steineri]